MDSGTPGIMGLTVAPHATHSLSSFLGARFEDQLLVGLTMTLTPNVDLPWVHEFSDRRDLSSTPPSLPGAPFRVDGARPPRNGTRVSAGAELAVSPRAALYADFDGEIADYSNTYSGNADVRFTW